MRSPLSTAVALLVIVAGVATSAVADGGAGWRIYRDPATGQLGVPPVEAVPEAAERQTAIPPPALEEQLTPGGTAAFIDLRGQFRAAVRAERGSDGVRVHCGPDGAAR